MLTYMTEDSCFYGVVKTPEILRIKGSLESKRPGSLLSGNLFTAEKVLDYLQDSIVCALVPQDGEGECDIDNKNIHTRIRGVKLERVFVVRKSVEDKAISIQFVDGPLWAGVLTPKEIAVIPDGDALSASKYITQHLQRHALLSSGIVEIKEGTFHIELSTLKGSSEMLKPFGLYHFRTGLGLQAKPSRASGYNNTTSFLRALDLDGQEGPNNPTINH